MDSKELLKRIGSIEDSLEKLRNSVYAMKVTDIKKYPVNYEELSTDAALRAERLTCQLRNLIFAADLSSKPSYMEKSAKAQGIRFGCENGVLEIYLPGLLPKRKVHANTAFINEPLYYALKNYIETQPIPIFDSCVVCFIQVYDRKLPLRRIRDYDNMEYKQILDTISPFVLRDDSGLFCDSYHTTELGDTDYTSVNIMEKSTFPSWLRSKKSSLSELSEIC